MLDFLHFEYKEEELQQRLAIAADFSTFQQKHHETFEPRLYQRAETNCRQWNFNRWSIRLSHTIQQYGDMHSPTGGLAPLELVQYDSYLFLLFVPPLTKTYYIYFQV